MAKQRVLLLGATGETGSSIITGLLALGKFEVKALIRPSSAVKPEVKVLAAKGVEVVLGDIAGPVDDLVSLLVGIDVFISAINGMGLLAQKNIATAAKKARVRRFVPCGFATVCPPGDVMLLRDKKEEVNQHIRKLFLPYTVIDVGYWYQLSIPRLPSGRIDDAIFPGVDTNLHCDGEAPNLLTDLRDVGYFVARIVDDERTLNKSVYAWGDVLSENQIWSTMEEISGETLERVSGADIEALIEQAKTLFAKEPENVRNLVVLHTSQYARSKYIRMDNRPEYAKYLGYLDARELYPDFKPKSLKEFVTDLLDGKVKRPYLSSWDKKIG